MNSISLSTAKHESYINIWRERVMACRSSGKTIVDWCAENGINLKTYYYWQKKVWDKEIMDLSPETKTKLLESRSIQFAQVNLGPVDGMGFLSLPDIFILCQQIQNAKCKERNRRFPVSACLCLSLSLPVFFWFSPCILLSGKQS